MCQTIKELLSEAVTQNEQKWVSAIVTLCREAKLEWKTISDWSSIPLKELKQKNDPAYPLKETGLLKQKNGQ